MIVNEISLVIQKTPECWNLILVEFTSFGEVLSRGELFLSNPRATSPGRRTNTHENSYLSGEFIIGNMLGD